MTKYKVKLIFRIKPEVVKIDYSVDGLLGLYLLPFYPVSSEHEIALFYYQRHLDGNIVYTNPHKHQCASKRLLGTKLESKGYLHVPKLEGSNDW